MVYDSQQVVRYCPHLADLQAAGVIESYHIPTGDPVETDVGGGGILLRDAIGIETVRHLLEGLDDFCRTCSRPGACRQS